MRLYLAGTETVDKYRPLLGIEGLRLLLSYHYIQGKKSGREALQWAWDNEIPVFLDSGAFSAFRIGAKIDLEEYIDFCLENQDRFEVIASLDVIGDHKNTLKNHIRMRDAGVRSIPTFHVRSPFEALRDLVQENDFIAFGVAGMQSRKKAIMAWLIHSFSIVRDANPNCRIHGFALTSTKIMKWFPWFSADSTSWLCGRKYGIIMVEELRDLHHISKRRAKDIISRFHRLGELFSSGKTIGFEWYPKVDAWNAREIIQWASSITPRKLNSFATGQVSKPYVPSRTSHSRGRSRSKSDHDTNSSSSSTSTEG